MWKATVAFLSFLTFSLAYPAPPTIENQPMVYSIEVLAPKQQPLEAKSLDLEAAETVNPSWGWRGNSWLGSGYSGWRGDQGSYANHNWGESPGWIQGPGWRQGWIHRGK